MKAILVVLAFLTIALAPHAAAAQTLVQQLTSNLAYAEEYYEYHPNDPYYPPRISGLKKQLAAAIAAEAAGTPLAPLRKENGAILPIHAPYVGGTASQADGKKGYNGARGNTGSKKGGDGKGKKGN